MDNESFLISSINRKLTILWALNLYNSKVNFCLRLTKMRLSTSPQIFRNKIVQNVNDYADFNQNNRPNSLSHLSLRTSKFQNRVQTPTYSPYYNQNSQVRVVSQQQVHFEPKTQSKLYGNVQNALFLQNNIKNLCEKVQIIEKRLKKQETQMNTLRKTNDQRYIVESLQDKINQQICKKSLSNYEKLYQQMKRIEIQITETLQLSSRKDANTFSNNTSNESNIFKVNQIQNLGIHKKNGKLIEDKVKQEIFKLQVHLQNEITKQFNLKKNGINSGNDEGNIFSILSKSKLKYKFLPLQINVKNEVSFKEPQSQKRRKQALSTEHSSGSSEQSQNRSQRKTIELEEFIYHIDKEGYLLDENGFYLLNQKQKMIKIDKKLIKKLQDLNMID